MLSIKATYEKGRIKLLEPVNIEDDTDVIITFLDDDFPFPDGSVSGSGADNQETSSAIPSTDEEEKPEKYYETLRRHKRFKAKGDITIIDGDAELTYPLNDYSAGGLSFVGDRVFELSKDITATLKYNVGDELLVMNFEMTVRGVFEEGEDNYKIGCQFFDQVDEQLWHTIMG
ncbi:MAG: hypothetical protein GY866_02505 [Proteobacteria bacterium]|nr:hypothetical protein [Pseudomonadota bacterium]